MPAMPTSVNSTVRIRLALLLLPVDWKSCYLLACKAVVVVAAMVAIASNTNK
jgi:hypothetical protein